MIRSILNGNNLRRASRQVVLNKGSAGIDGIPVQDLIGYFDTSEAAMLFIPEGTPEKDIQTRAEQLAEFERNKDQLVALDKSWKRFKTNLKAITRKTAPYSFDERIRKLKEVQRG